MKRPCRMCGALPSKWWPYCTSCDALFGVPIVAWIVVGFLAVGVYAMFAGNAFAKFGGGAP